MRNYNRLQWSSENDDPNKKKQEDPEEEEKRRSRIWNAFLIAIVSIWMIYRLYIRK